MTRVPGLDIDLERREVRRNGVVVALTPREADVLAYLSKRQGIIVTRKELEREVWEFRAGVRSQAVPVGMRRLRQKLEIDDDTPTVLIIHKSRGYEMVLEDEVEALRTYDTPWVPRPAEQTAVVQALESGHVISLVGGSGMGKTRLAVQTLLERGDRAALLDFANVPEGSPVETAVEQQLGCDAEAWLLRLRSLDVVVLDNAEHVLDGLARALGQWMRSVPACRFLVTSRSDLRIPGEVTVRVGPLDTQQALQMFRDHRTVDEEERALSIVRQVDGVPLALELVARLRGDLAAVEQSVMDGRVRGARVRGRDERSSSVEGALRCSWKLLAQSEREVLAACAQFAGALDQEGVQALVGNVDVDEAMEVLVEHSLVERRPDGLYLRWMVRVFARQAHEDGELRTRFHRWLVDVSESLIDLTRGATVHLRRMERASSSLWDLLKDRRAPHDLRGRAGVVLGRLGGVFSAVKIQAVLAPVHVQLSDVVTAGLTLNVLIDEMDGGRVDDAALLASDHPGLTASQRAALYEQRMLLSWFDGRLEEAEARCLETLSILADNPYKMRIQGSLATLRLERRGAPYLEEALAELDRLLIRAHARGWDVVHVVLLAQRVNLLSWQGRDAEAVAGAMTLIDAAEGRVLTVGTRGYALLTSGLCMLPTHPSQAVDMLRRNRVRDQQDGIPVGWVRLAVEMIGHFVLGDEEAYRHTRAVRESGVDSIFTRVIGAIDNVFDHPERLKDIAPSDVGDGLGRLGAQRDGALLLDRLNAYVAWRNDEMYVRYESPSLPTVVRALDRALDEFTQDSTRVPMPPTGEA